MKRNWIWYWMYICGEVIGQSLFPMFYDTGDKVKIITISNVPTLYVIREAEILEMKEMAGELHRIAKKKHKGSWEKIVETLGNIIIAEAPREVIDNSRKTSYEVPEVQMAKQKMKEIKKLILKEKCEVFSDESVLSNSVIDTSVNNRNKRADGLDEVAAGADPRDVSEDYEELTEEEQSIPFDSLGSDKLPLEASDDCGDPQTTNTLSVKCIILYMKKLKDPKMVYIGSNLIIQLQKKLRGRGNNNRKLKPDELINIYQLTHIAWPNMNEEDNMKELNTRLATRLKMGGLEIQYQNRAHKPRSNQGREDKIKDTGVKWARDGVQQLREVGLELVTGRRQAVIKFSTPAGQNLLRRRYNEVGLDAGNISPIRKLVFGNDQDLQNSDENDTRNKNDEEAENLPHIDGNDKEDEDSQNKNENNKGDNNLHDAGDDGKKDNEREIEEEDQENNLKNGEETENTDNGSENETNKGEKEKSPQSRQNGRDEDQREELIDNDSQKET